MYLFKNAIRNIHRAIGKNILIGIIVLIIGFACCLSLSIKQAAQTTKEEGLANLNVTANISYDRKNAMQNMEPLSEGEELDKSLMAEIFSQGNLSIDELETYAKAKSVKDFYYTSSLSLNGAEGTLDPIESTSNDSIGGGKNGMGGMEMNTADFTLVGYSDYDAMNDFTSGVKSVEEGSLFSIDADNECIISDELAVYNSIEVGDTITLTNPNNEEETFTLSVTGIYTNNESDTMGFQRSDPANQIYTSYQATNALVKVSEANSENESESTYLTALTNGTYVFDSVEDYEAFEEEARALGLDESYTITSTDITAYEQSLTPLTNLANYANTFLWVILAIGGAILIIFNIFRLRERKYEIGVLAAIGMNKIKIAIQFMIELFIVTFVAIIIGVGLGSISSVPITNSLLAQSSTTSSMQSQMHDDMGSGGPGTFNEEAPSTPQIDDKGQGMFAQGIDYISEVTNATNFTVVLQLLGIGLLLTIISGAISILFILRYEPLRILSDRE